jgi:hypothetical protein
MSLCLSPKLGHLQSLRQLRLHPAGHDLDSASSIQVETLSSIVRWQTRVALQSLFPRPLARLSSTDFPLPSLLLSPAPPPPSKLTGSGHAPAPKDEETPAAAATVGSEAMGVPRRRRRVAADEVRPEQLLRVKLVQIVVVPCKAGQRQLLIPLPTFELHVACVALKLPWEKLGPALSVPSTRGPGLNAGRQQGTRTEAAPSAKEVKPAADGREAMVRAGSGNGAADGALIKPRPRGAGEIETEQVVQCSCDGTLSSSTRIRWVQYWIAAATDLPQCIRRDPLHEKQVRNQYNRERSMLRFGRTCSTPATENVKVGVRRC